MLEEGKKVETEHLSIISDLSQGGERSTANLLKEGKEGRIEKLRETADLQKGDGRVGRIVEEQVEIVVVEYLERKVMSKEGFELWGQLDAFMGKMKKGETEWMVAVEWEAKTKDERFKEMVSEWLNPEKERSDKEDIRYDVMRRIEIKSYSIASEYVLNMRGSLRGDWRVYEEPERGLERI